MDDRRLAQFYTHFCSRTITFYDNTYYFSILGDTFICIILDVFEDINLVHLPHCTFIAAAAISAFLCALLQSIFSCGSNN